MSKLDEILDNIGDICHEKYTGCTHTNRLADEWDYSYTDEVVNLLQDPRVKEHIKDLYLAYLYGLKAMLEDPSMNAKTPSERVDDVIDSVKEL